MLPCFVPAHAGAHVLLRRPRVCSPAATAFVPSSPARPATALPHRVSAASNVSMLTLSSISDRSYQLEEMEDEATQTSSLFLHADGTVAHGRTDGPQPSAAAGEWSYDEKKQEMVLAVERKFADKGIEFAVRRVFHGHLDCKKDMDYAVFVGNIFREEKDIDDLKSALGAWSLVVATDDLPSENFDATQA